MQMLPHSQMFPRGAQHSRVGALLAVAALGMAAKAGTVETSSILMALERTRRVFGEADPLFCAVSDFSARRRMLEAAPDELVAAGDALMRSLERASWPDASGRADIDG